MTDRPHALSARPLIGAHASVAGGLTTGGLAYAAATGTEAIQVFVANPRRWTAPPGDPAQDEALRQAALPVFVHASYLINLGSSGAGGRAVRRGDPGRPGGARPRHRRAQGAAGQDGLSRERTGGSRPRRRVGPRAPIRDRLGPPG